MAQVKLEYEGRAQTYLLRQCRVCVMPLVSPVPPEMTFDLVKEGPASGPVHAFITPHREGCTAPKAEPKPGLAVRIPGSVLTLGEDEVTGVPHAFAPFTFGSRHEPASADWCAFGAVAHMLTGRGFCGRVEDHPLHLPVRLVRRGETFPHFQVRRPDGRVSTKVPLGVRVEPIGLDGSGEVTQLDLIVYEAGGPRVLYKIAAIPGDSFTVGTVVS
jgi:hypothetical protein